MLMVRIVTAKSWIHWKRKDDHFNEKSIKKFENISREMGDI